jgi:tetratricopeptide (TPR) repeat protein
VVLFRKPCHAVRYDRNLVSPEHGVGGRKHKYLSHVITGDAYKSLGDLDKSLYHYNEALSLIDNPGVIYKIARVYQDKGDNKKTLKYLNEAIATKEDILYAYPVLIDTYLALGEEKKAEETKKTYTRLKSEVAVKMHFEKGKNAYNNRNYRDAVEEFRKAIKADPSNPAAYANLGYVYLEIGQDMKAHEYLLKALQIDPEEATAEEIERPNAHFGLAMIYRKMGNTAKAREHLEEFLKIEPSGHFSRKAEKLMEDM